MKRTTTMKVRCSTCGVVFSSKVLNLREEDGLLFYCPNGHSLSFREAIEKERAEKEAEEKRIQTEVQELELLFVREPTLRERARHAISIRRR
jgi:hypothetical protein